MECKKCGCFGIWKTEQKGHNQVAYCGRCGAFIQNIPYDKPRMYIGKFKGEAIEEIEDVGYLKWAYENMNGLGKRQKDAILQQYMNLQNLLK